HFLEHMFFKGTEKRSAQEIAKEIDAIGGELNAFTSRETTTFYAKVLDEHLPKAVEILSDNFHASTFAPKEMEREKQVVMEEIKMVEDDPEDLVHDLYAEEVWEGNPLGRTILGTPMSIRGISRNKILHFLRHRYHPKEIVISVAGNFDPDLLFKTLDREFGSFKRPEAEIRPRVGPTFSRALHIRKRKLEQVHLCLGTRGLPHGHRDRYGLYVLNTILGGSVSSRLFQEIRERRGMTYSIYSYLSSYQDAGLFTVYAATSRKNFPKVIGLILREFKKIRQKGVDKAELMKAKNHIKGSLMLSMESTSARMSKLAKEEIYFGRYFTLEEVLGEIDKVEGTIQKLAYDLFNPAYYSLTALGEVSRRNLPASLAATF
ncbi:MAG TPA: pitrilysin family protein, partial [Nitrospiria bacterium]|nr:pitrilysin family protein [Nitrospiria bacterium]